MNVPDALTTSAERRESYRWRREAEDQAGITMNTTSHHSGRDHNTTDALHMITVKNRKLEQFYYAHGVDFVSYRKDQEDGLTVWEYVGNEENRHMLE